MLVLPAAAELGVFVLSDIVEEICCYALFCCAFCFSKAKIYEHFVECEIAATEARKVCVDSLILVYVDCCLLFAPPASPLAISFSSLQSNVRIICIFIPHTTLDHNVHETEQEQ